jgi:hypothetical protein
MKYFLKSDWLRAVQFARNTMRKMKYSANCFDYLDFLFGLTSWNNHKDSQ